ncbi:hypothetical protein Ga0466249_004836 [Sporomusaceae bacterium BoRhaA]|uniref:tail assembly chaperone n=1 Tax=Pelorhabdus rhamnosifermentans TaxID=2772457 RepID=UPI001C061F35|nr:tail assembly chaperone [Pelorhabdus rhamnosifermentans]MBU2703688.1 hypothetical protein [Pelorhabdus rhamnosifermentans]
MKLSELFPEAVKVKIQGIQYGIKFGTRALIQMEQDYPDEKERVSLLKAGAPKKKGKEDAPQMMIKIRSTADMVNMLYAGLLHTKAFPDKDDLIDAIEPHDYPDYINAIFSASVQSKATPEQLEKMQVMSEVNGSKKNEGHVTTAQNMPFIGQSAG